MKFSIKNNFPELYRDMAGLRDDIRGPATVRALNRTMDLGQTVVVRQITQEFNIARADVKGRLRIKKATLTQGMLNIQVELEVTSKRGRSLNLIRFVEKSVTMAQARKRMAAGEGGAHRLRNGGVITKTLELRFKIKRTGPAKVIPGAFIGNDGRTVFQRIGKSRLPIKALQTIDIGQMYNAWKVNSLLISTLLGRFPEVWQREVAFYTDRFNRKKATV